MIDSSIMNLMMELATFSFIVPLVLIIVWKLRTRKSLIPVFIGAGRFTQMGIVRADIKNL